MNGLMHGMASCMNGLLPDGLMHEWPQVWPGGDLQVAGELGEDPQ